MSYITQLFSSDDAAADMIAWAAAVSVLGLLGLAFYQTVAHGTVIGITEAGTGLATVIGAGGAVRVGRERFCKKD